MVNVENPSDLIEHASEINTDEQQLQQYRAIVTYAIQSWWLPRRSQGNKTTCNGSHRVYNSPWPSFMPSDLDLCPHRPKVTTTPLWLDVYQIWQPALQSFI